MNNAVRRGLMLWGVAVVIGVAWGLMAFSGSSQAATVIGSACAVVALALLVIGGVSISRGIQD